MASYKLENYEKGHLDHAEKVEVKKYHEECVAKLQETCPGTACILNDAFILAHLTNDGYLSGMSHKAHAPSSFVLICLPLTLDDQL